MSFERARLAVVPFLVATSVACSSAPPPDEAHAAASAKQQDTTWRMLTLVVGRTEVDFVSPTTGQATHVSSTMSAEDRATASAEARLLPGLIGTLSGGLGRATMDVVEVSDPLRTVTPIGNDFWVDRRDLAGAIAQYAPRGRYDSIFVVWSAGNDQSAVPSCCHFGIGPDAPGAPTWAALHPSANAEAFLHEWLHGSTYYYTTAGFDVPDPHENSTYGFPTAVNDSWQHWYGALMTGRIRKGTTAVGFTPAVWAAPTARSSAAAGTQAPPAMTDPAEAPPQAAPPPSTIPAPTNPTPPTPTGGRPTIRQAFMQGPEWLYVEWDAVAGAADYSIYAIANSATGGTAGVFTRMDAGAADRGPFRYTYVNKTDLCQAVARAQSPANPATLAVQVWPGTDSSRFEHKNVDGTVSCP